MAVIEENSDAFVVDGNEAISMKLIRSEDDINNEEIEFKPAMCHQIFGPKETVYGYKDLKVKIYFSGSLKNCYLGLDFTQQVNAKKTLTEPDNIEEILSQKLGLSFNRNLDDFIKELKVEEKVKPYGNLLHTCLLPTNESGDKTFCIYQCDITTPGLIPFYEKLQTFIFWYIDAASFIDLDDEKWKIYLVYEKYIQNGDTNFGIVGFATVYEYYAYPEHLRPRISQMLILPLFQRCGLGAELIETIYSNYQKNSKVRDITVEDPSDELQLVRDYVDCKLLKQLPEIKSKDTIIVEDVLKAAASLKINQKQARRVYEILKLEKIPSGDENKLREYRLEVKARLNIPHQNEVAKLKRLEKCLKPQELAEVKNSLQLSQEHRHATLDSTYRTLEEQYKRVLNRLLTS